MKQLYEFATDIVEFLAKNKTPQGFQPTRISTELSIGLLETEQIIARLVEFGIVAEYQYGDPAFKISGKGELLYSYKDYRPLLALFPPLGSGNDLTDIEKHREAALRQIRLEGIGKELVWHKIAFKAEIPAQYSDDVKNILYDEGFIEKTKTAQFMGDLFRGKPKITSYLIGLKNHTVEPGVTINMSNNSGVIVHQSPLNDLIIDSKNVNTKYTSSTNNQKSFWHKKFDWAISHIWKIVIALLIAYIIFKLGWN